jgi:hypothetical protein
MAACYGSVLVLTPAHETIARQAWTRETLAPRDWLVSVPAACVAELDAALAQLHAAPRPLETLSPADFDLRACTALMDRVREKPGHGEGQAVLDRFPVERYTEAQNRARGWLLAAMLGPVVSQKWDGTRVYDVKDSGQPLGYGVRRSVTNFEQPFHTDGGWLWRTPALVGLFCLESAEEGGRSRFVSLMTAHERLRERAPDLLDRLYRPFWWPGTAALAALRAIVDAPEQWVEFRIEKGQLQYLNNRRFAHSRTGFADSGGTSRRHMLRFWNREEGTTQLEGR